jgi:PLP dependent protein
VPEPAAADRRAALRTGLDATVRRIDDACMAAGRPRKEVHLVVVTKFFPASDVRLLAELGVTDVGENRDQEAGAKLEELGGLRERLRVHFIGQLQTNKAASVAGYADVVHSVDRPRLVAALDKGAARHERRLEVLVQVDLGGCTDGTATGRGGAAPEHVLRLADAIAGARQLRLRGVMAVAPLGADPRRAFARLREVAAGIRAEHPLADWISAGMSGDLEAAVAEGATHLRVGSAILGSRPPLR